MSMEPFGTSDSLTSTRDAAHPNPMYDYLSGFVPRKLKDLFKTAEYLAFNSAHIYAIVKKFGEYPITRLVYETTSDNERERHKDLYEKIYRMKGFLTKVSFDKWIYGNSFVSRYEPFKRELVCPCGTRVDIKEAKYAYDIDKVVWKLKGCKACGRTGVVDVRETKLNDRRKLGLIRWDPKLIDIDHNPITGESVYYYQIPRQIIEQVKAGNKNLINLMPIEMLKAMRKRKTFRFAEGQLYHMKVPGPAGVEAHWGFPPITAAIKLFLFAAILRKANECVGFDTLIETSTGLVRADDVRVGDRVRTHTGAWQAVTDKWYRDARPEEVGRKITVSGLRAFPSTFSPHHPVAVLRPIKDPNAGYHPASRVLEAPDQYEEVFAPADQLQVGDHVLYPRYLPATPQVLDVAALTGLRRTEDYVYCNDPGDAMITAYEALEKGRWVPHDGPGKTAKRAIKEGRVPHRLPAQRPLTPDLAYILGWYAGDGSCGTRTVMFSLGLGNDHMPLLRAITQEFNTEPTCRVMGKGNVRTITICDSLVRQLIKGLVPGTSLEKRVPLSVLNAPDAVKLAFLRGYHEADGHEAPALDCFATGSKGLAYDVYRLLLHVGCVATIGTHLTKDSPLRDGRVIKGGRVHYQIRTNGPSRDRLHALWREERAADVATGRAGFFWQNYFAARIYAIEEAKETAYIDFKVERDETFNTPGISTKNSISLEHITPFRVMFPQTGSGNGDPITTINLATWREQLESNYKQFRRDPLRIMFAPAPVGMQNIGGDGKAMLTISELQEAEKNIVLSMGVPLEFLTGGLGQTRGEVTLRMIENQLQTHIEDLNDLLQWVEDGSSSFLGWERVGLKLADFKMIDDVENKQMLSQLWQAGKLDDTTMYEALNLDAAQIRKQKLEDALADAKAQAKQEAELNKFKNSLSNKAQQDALKGQNQPQYDQQAIVAQADQMAQEFAQMDAGTRRSRMDALKNEDLVMAAVVRERLEQMGQDQAAAQKAEQQQGGGG